MSDPRNPRQTANLLTPAMETPHESLYLNQRRGLLAAVAGNVATAPGQVDIYDLQRRLPPPAAEVARSRSAVLGHESGFARDGKTFYVTSTAGQTLTALDVTDPSHAARRSPRSSASTTTVSG